MPDMAKKYQGRRFLSLLLTTGLLTLAYFLGRPEIFGAYSTALGGMYSVYLIGQSATNWAKTKNGGVVDGN